MPPEILEIGLAAFTTFFATIGPIDAAAIFAALTAGVPARQRRKTAFKSVSIAAIILMVFVLFGGDVLRYMGISMAALKTAGGILLLLVGIDMVLARSSGATSTTDIEAEEAHHRDDISVFPLATPLIAGPGTISAAVLLVAKTDGQVDLIAVVIAALLLTLLITLICFLMATQLHRLLGVTGLNVITRVVGVLLSALAVQFVFDGIESSGLLEPMTRSLLTDS